jgi:acetoin utilization deacetylase AcuC-like enzyme
MLIFHSPTHLLHAPAHEIFRGERVACLETPARAEFVREALAARGHAFALPEADASAILEQVHAPRYLAFLQNAWDEWLALEAGNAQRQPFPSVWPVRGLRSDVEPRNFTARLGLYSMDNGSPLSPGAWAAAKAGADMAASAAARIAAGVRAAFCLTRPPGHHAGPDFMGGYCFVNSAAVAAQALRAGGCERVAVLDVDYHHGNGTQAIFDERADVLTLSLHGDPRTEYPFFLGHADERGHGAGEGFNMNLPLPAGCPVDVWFYALDAALARIRSFKPGALVVALGLDTFEGDPIASFHLRADDYRRLGERLARLGLATVFTLEGGYAAAELGLNAAAVLDGFEQA